MLVFHHAIYSPAAHANDGDNKDRREDFPTAFSNLGVDLVLAGPRPQLLAQLRASRTARRPTPAEQPGAAQVAPGPGGVIYVTGNSASGSKYYDLTHARRRHRSFGPDPLDPTGKRHCAQLGARTRSTSAATSRCRCASDALVVENIRSGTCAAPNAAVERGNVSWCGPNSGATAAQPVGSVVDKVVDPRG